MNSTAYHENHADYHKYFEFNYFGTTPFTRKAIIRTPENELTDFT